MLGGILLDVTNRSLDMIGMVQKNFPPIPIGPNRMLLPKVFVHNKPLAA